MPLIQLVPKAQIEKNWWKKTLFIADDDGKLNGCEYVFNVSLENAYLATEITEEDIRKYCLENKLIDEAVLKKHGEFKIQKTNKEGGKINLELKLGKIPLVIKMNCHLGKAPVANQYVPPAMRTSPISNIDALVNLLPIKDFLAQLGAKVEKLSKMDENNCGDFGYKLAKSSKDYLSSDVEEKKKLKV